MAIPLEVLKLKHISNHLDNLFEHRPLDLTHGLLRRPGLEPKNVHFQ